MAIKSYTSVAASNTSLFPENMAPSAVNDGMRQVQADIVSQFRDAEWLDWGDVVSRASGTTFKIAADVTTRYLVNRRAKCYDASTLYGTITASSFSAPDTTVTLVLDSGALTASLSSVALGILSPTNQSIPGFEKLIISGTSSLSGAAVFKTTATVEGVLTVGGASTYSGAAVFKTTASIEGESTLSGTVTMKTVVAGGALADQSAMEAATAVNRIVTPGRQHFHPSAAKFWVNFTGTGTVTINASHNVTSVTDNGTGIYTVNITTVFSSATYATVGLLRLDGSSGSTMQQQAVASAAGTFPVQTHNGAAALADATAVYLAGFGDQ